jgi:photosystem II reaction center protein PsbP
VQFLSDHPNPENRITNVQREITRLGGLPPNARRESSDFSRVRASLASMPGPRRNGNTGNGGRTTDNRTGRPPAPSDRTATYRGQDLDLTYPNNWRQYGEGSAVTLAPEGGVINGALTYGMMVSDFETDYHGQGRISLEEGTDQLLNELQRSNPQMRVIRNHERIRVGGRQGYLAEATNESPAGGRETDWIVTVLSPDGVLYYFVGVAPQNEFSRYNNVFEDIVDSVRFR